MATYAAHLKNTAVDNTSIALNPDSTISGFNTFGPMQPAGRVFYVDGNRVTSGNGNTWETAFCKLSEGLAASHANIGLTPERNWAGRNTIYFKGDDVLASGNQVEDLAIFAQKTDIIGVGGCNAYNMPQLLGNHESTNCGNTRFYNIMFRVPTGGGVIMKLDSENIGIQFHNCVFNGWHDTPASYGIEATAAPHLKVINCDFLGRFSSAAIILKAGAAEGTRIQGNCIESAGIGIDVDSGFTCLAHQAHIINNRIVSAGFVIDDDSDKITFIGNLCSCTGAGFGDGTSHDVPAAMSVGNIISGNNTCASVPFALVTV